MIGKLWYYFLALRPWSFQAAIPSVTLGSLLSWKYQDRWDFSKLFLSLAVTLSLQGAANLLNTYFDYVKGYDTEESYGDPTLVRGLLNIFEVWILASIMYFCACLSLYFLEVVTHLNLITLGKLFWVGLILTYMYNGGIKGFALKYFALGDFAIFVSFGPMMAVFGYLSQCGEYSWLPVWYSIPVGLRVEAILHANNHRDLESDRRNGAITVANLLGNTLSTLFMFILLFFPYIFCVLQARFLSTWYLAPLLSIPSAWHSFLIFQKENRRDIPAVIAKQHSLFSLLYLLAVYNQGTV
ncbi:1,4-dihydroxy-2-naphthoate octaprenyltransferase [Galdieria sulphuraria]|uniref:1,4-dihydroxy-2-naphthoate octaprenyltransferase n=1 Tax=Galdieria sulphuraria TaxID=130081 RepID=M2XGU5_GALSU|nr:1,4-dihydroxy-2-naphthoate octaprenyltransferase [Galdieria sulphuraria]EME29292.1 1,4-dihydroxy-2-naphthoate octaprenyltransferase [Galdieria sulphuraria]|eukprot:XP_005705812.1 1,4-dihydroxy-2-naphthoate octaprenyltransferase [Galdieria sulphuraria]